MKKLNLLILGAVVLTTLNLRAAVTSLTDIYAYVKTDVVGFNVWIMGVLPLLCFAFFGLVAPKLQKIFGFEKVLCGSMLFIGVGLTLRFLTSNFWVFAGFSVLAFANMTFGNILIPPIFKKYFPQQIGMITSVYSVVLAFSAGLPSILSSDLTPQFGWQVSLGIWAVMAFVSVAPWLAQIILHPNAVKPEGGSPSETASFNHVHVMRWKTSWTMAMLFGVGGMLPMYTMIDWLPYYLMGRGVSIKDAGMMLFLYNILGVIHSFLVPLILGKMKQPFLLIILAVTLQIVGYLGFLYDVQHALAWCIITAPGLLTIPLTFQLFNMRSKTANGAAHLSSFVQFFGYLIAAAGPFGFGYLIRVTGSFVFPFWLLIVFSLMTLHFGKESLREGFVEDQLN